jgi:hypothetical protein
MAAFGVRREKAALCAKPVAWRERPVDLDSLSFIRIERCGLPFSIDV